jgi:hypothetical protein
MGFCAELARVSGHYPPRSTALQRDLDEYLRYFNFDRAHTGRLTNGRVPGDIVFGARKTKTVR